MSLRSAVARCAGLDGPTMTMPSNPIRHSRRNPTAAVISSREVLPHLTRRRQVSANLPMTAASALVITGGVSMMTIS